MKILHTADWHLGQKFYYKTREEEHQKTLDWLLVLIEEQQIELLILAGDVFDTDSPPNYARKLYFNFLKKLTKTCCQNVVVVAGNHDSSNMLTASKELLELLNVYVMGHIPERREEQIIEIRNPNNQLTAVVAAVPYLRARDIRQHQAGESINEREEAIRLGIKKHYQEIETALLPYQNKNVPIIVTGHLYADGGSRGDRPDNIHIGCIDVVGAANFSTDFDYIALGHLHRVQQIDKTNNRPIWYSGSLIPLDFSEYNYSQAVIVVEFEDRKISSRKSIKVELKRKLRQYKGSIDFIRNKLENLSEDVALPTWIRIDVETDYYLPNLDNDLQEIIANKPAEIIKIYQQITSDARQTLEEEILPSLQEMETIDVFEKCALQNGPLEQSDWEELKGSFVELLNYMEEQDSE